MTTIIDDKGQRAISVGAPGSIERVKVQYPALLERLNALFYSAYDSYGRAVDKALELIRQAGVTSPLETNSILAASHYGTEPQGSVTGLVLAAGSGNLDRFMAIYEKHLRSAIQEFPTEYAYGLELVPTVLARMRAAIVKQSANYNSHAFKRTCQELGIKHTGKAIQAFINS